MQAGAPATRRRRPARRAGPPGGNECPARCRSARGTQLCPLPRWRPPRYCTSSATRHYQLNRPARLVAPDQRTSRSAPGYRASTAPIAVALYSWLPPWGQSASTDRSETSTTSGHAWASSERLRALNVGRPAGTFIPVGRFAHHRPDREQLEQRLLLAPAYLSVGQVVVRSPRVSRPCTGISALNIAQSRSTLPGVPRQG
jgi:hypothetical protein